jgi:hypothetical protein
MPLEISSLSPLHTLTFFASGWMFCASPSFASSAEQFRDTVAVPGGSDEPVGRGMVTARPKSIVRNWGRAFRMEQSERRSIDFWSG